MLCKGLSFSIINATQESGDIEVKNTWSQVELFPLYF